MTHQPRSFTLCFLTSPFGPCSPCSWMNLTFVEPCTLRRYPLFIFPPTLSANKAYHCTPTMTGISPPHQQPIPFLASSGSSEVRLFESFYYIECNLSQCILYSLVLLFSTNPHPPPHPRTFFFSFIILMPHNLKTNKSPY